MKALDKLHPIVAFAYFGAVISINMFITEIISLFLCLVLSLVLRFMLKQDKFLNTLIFVAVTTLVVTAINTMINRSGTTVLGTIFSLNITLEAIVFGLKLSFLYLSVINWFFCYSIVVTSDKFIYLFGKIFPSASLLFCMVMRFIPYYQRKFNQISSFAKCIGKGILKGQSKKQNILNATTLLGCMMTISLENSIYTAQSMKSRGYGIKGKTNYSIYKFRNADKMMLSIIVLSVMGFLFLGILHHYPLQLTFLMVLLGLPNIYILIEENKWNILKSKI